MTKIYLSNEWIKENGEKIKEAYSYAVVNKLDIKSLNNVLQVLKKVDPKNANEEYAEEFSKVLQLFRKQFRKTIEER